MPEILEASLHAESAESGKQPVTGGTAALQKTVRLEYRTPRGETSCWLAQVEVPYHMFAKYSETMGAGARRTPRLLSAVADDVRGSVTLQPRAMPMPL